MRSAGGKFYLHHVQNRRQNRSSGCPPKLPRILGINHSMNNFAVVDSSIIPHKRWYIKVCQPVTHTPSFEIHKRAGQRLRKNTSALSGF